MIERKVEQGPLYLSGLWALYNDNGATNHTTQVLTRSELSLHT